MPAGEVPRGEKMLYFGTDPELCITEYTLVKDGHAQVPDDFRAWRISGNHDRPMAPPFLRGFSRNLLESLSLYCSRA